MGSPTSAASAGSFAARVLEVVASTRPGELLTYGEVAVEAGAPGAARAVGRALRASGAEVPWWRIVRADGRLAAGLVTRQAALLAAEGIATREGRLEVAVAGRQGARPE